MEVWRNIKDYEGLYQVSNYGRVKSLEREYIHHLWKNHLYGKKEFQNYLMLIEIISQ